MLHTIIAGGLEVIITKDDRILSSSSAAGVLRD